MCNNSWVILYVLFRIHNQWGSEHLHVQQYMVLNVLSHRQGSWRTEFEYSHWGSLLQQYLSAKQLLMLTDSWASTPRAVHRAERGCQWNRSSNALKESLDIPIWNSHPTTLPLHFFSLHDLWKPSKVEKEFAQGTLTVGTQSWWCRNSWHGSSEDVTWTSASDYS